MRKYLLILLFCVALVSIRTQAFAVLINFDDQGLSGPQLFGGVMQVIALTNVGGSGIDATFSGGVILTNATNFPANHTSVYGTYSGVTGYTNPMTVTFSQPVSNFFLDLYNGWTSDRTFTVFDNSGNSTTVTLPPNTSSGQTLVSFSAAGSIISLQDVTIGVSTWDFLIDNIHFNEPLPTVPEPATMLLLGAGLLGLVGLRGRLKK